jgi:hypothetical protein
VQVAAILHGEQQVLAFPDRLAHRGIGSAVPVEHRRQEGALSGFEVEHRDLPVVRLVAHPDRCEAEGDPRAVRRPRRRLGHAVGEGDTFGLAAGRVDDVDVRDDVDVPVPIPGRRKSDTRTVRRPGRLGVLEVTVRQLGGLGRSVGRNGEHVLPAVSRPPLVVQFELKTREPPRSAALVVLLVVRLVGHAGAERDLRAVGAPDRVLHSFLEVREPLRFSARSGDHVELRLFGSSVRDERETGPVRRPPRGEVPLSSPGQAPGGRRAINGRKPDRAGVRVLLLVDLDDDVRNGSPVGRDSGIGRPLELIDVFGKHALTRFVSCESEEMVAASVAASKPEALWLSIPLL